MSLAEFIITVFCLIDDFLIAMTQQGITLRARGPAPTLADSEVLTMEVVGEFLGFDEDSRIFTYFRRHYSAFFPTLRTLDRTRFVRQAATLCMVKHRLWKHLLERIAFDAGLSIIDSFLWIADDPSVCRFARAPRCKRLRELASYGYDEMAKQTYFGLRAHVQIAWPGVIVGFDVAPAHVHDLTMARELTRESFGYLLGDRNYWSPHWHEEAAKHDLKVLTPEKSRKREKRPWPRWLVQMRRRIETVIGQLVERFQAKRVWARDRWHVVSRFLRKLCSHTMAVLLCQRQGLPPLRFSELIVD